MGFFSIVFFTGGAAGAGLAAGLATAAGRSCIHRQTAGRAHWRVQRFSRPPAQQAQDILGQTSWGLSPGFLGEGGSSPPGDGSKMALGLGARCHNSASVRLGAWFANAGSRATSRHVETDGGLYWGYRGTRRINLYCGRLLGRRFLRGHRRIHQTDAAHAHSSSISALLQRPPLPLGLTARVDTRPTPQRHAASSTIDCNNRPTTPVAALRRTPRLAVRPRGAAGPTGGGRASGNRCCSRRTAERARSATCSSIPEGPTPRARMPPCPTRRPLYLPRGDRGVPEFKRTRFAGLSSWLN